ncbi:hypothetical protein PGT21_024795 [Puccinia graminis f. sp. tritici]|uniref:Uncharacterized protein n=2 Tax=Puccinia graminis f. sp. tritici TaxID=56615 RepID=E3K739_PUCGT|nr:uncharacterized protein PGTG_05330 [Puccinia graminis f. sp. tritici CRL 75-36-700-3]EFP80105.2 hypothetical protein PGTG_05330 [Puccinia graminis f. sp. tritici CRL 75-36-700-3]KAA1091100.1 hypothetical protein PGT21_024795 [Puccinia graminis f. sp. tritici]
MSEISLTINLLIPSQTAANPSAISSISNTTLISSTISSPISTTQLSNTRFNQPITNQSQTITLVRHWTQLTINLKDCTQLINILQDRTQLITNLKHWTHQFKTPAINHLNHSMQLIIVLKNITQSTVRNSSIQAKNQARESHNPPTHHGLHHQETALIKEEVFCRSTRRRENNGKYKVRRETAVLMIMGKLMKNPEEEPDPVEDEES